MKFQRFILWLLFIPLTCCQIKEQGTLTIQAQPVVSTQSLGSDSFFGWIRDIKIYGDKIYLADHTRNQIHVVTLDLQYVESIGLDENSPLAFKGIQNMVVVDSALYVNDLSGGSIIEFNGNEFIRTHKIPIGMGDFSVLDNQLLVNPIDYSHDVGLSYDVRNQAISSRFGGLSQGVQGHPNFHILASSQFLVAVPRENSALIRVYNTSFQLLSETNLGENSMLSTWLEGLSVESRVRANPTFSQVIFRDAVLSGNRLFLMTPEQTIHDVREPIFIYEFTIREGGSLHETRRIQIADSSQGSFYCFDISTLHKIMVFYDPVEGSVVTYSIE